MILYIIGNGFDLNDGLQTTYDDFREHLLKYNKEFYEKLTHFFGFDSGCWSDIETQMYKSKLKIANFVNDIESSQWCEDFCEWDDPSKNDSDEQYAIEYDIQQNIISPKELNFHVKSWIKSTLDNKILKKITINDAIINFNYTSRFKGEHLLNIHGTFEEETINFGHSAEVIDEVRQVTDYGNERTSHIHIYNLYNKGAKKLVNKFVSFVNSIDVSEVIIKGLSLGKQDIHYIKTLDKNKKISYYYLDNKDQEQKEMYDKLHKIGFKNINAIKWSS